MNKSKLRRNITFLRKKNFQENLKINSYKLIKFIRDNKLKTKIVGGYYPCNHEIDDLEVLSLFKNSGWKKLEIFQPGEELEKLKV